ncbi:MAG: hypothetical protein WBO48_10950 [Candidatus Promineifilaceae bacterium]
MTGLVAQFTFYFTGKWPTTQQETGQNVGEHHPVAPKLKTGI